MAKQKHSSIQLTMKWLVENYGNALWHIEVQQYFKPFGKKGGCRKDPWGFIDIGMMSKFNGALIAVQACMLDGRGEHLRKMLALETVKSWLLEREIWLISWRLIKDVKQDGTKAKDDVWEPVIDNIISFEQLKELAMPKQEVTK